MKTWAISTRSNKITGNKILTGKTVKAANGREAANKAAALFQGLWVSVVEISETTEGDTVQS